MTTPIRFGAPRRESSRADTASHGVFWQRIAGKMGLGRPAEQREQDAAERAISLSAFLRGDAVPGIWPDHLQPVFLQLHDETLSRLLDAFRAHEPEPLIRHLGGALDMLQRFGEAIDASINFGAGAMQRIAERQIRSKVAAEATKEAAATR